MLMDRDGCIYPGTEQRSIIRLDEISSTEALANFFRMLVDLDQAVIHIDTFMYDQSENTPVLIEQIEHDEGLPF